MRSRFIAPGLGARDTASVPFFLMKFINSNVPRLETKLN
jgi:hypothetical protein